MDYGQIETLLERSVGALLVDLGRELRPPGLGMEPTSDDENFRQGQSWIDRNRPALARRLCSTMVVRLWIQSKRVGDRVLLVAAIADLITSLLTGVAAVTVAVLLVKEGLDTLCMQSS